MKRVYAERSGGFKLISRFLAVLTLCAGLAACHGKNGSVQNDEGSAGGVDVVLQDSLGRDGGIIELPEFISYQQDSSAFHTMLDTLREYLSFRGSIIEDLMSKTFDGIKMRDYIITPKDLRLIVCY